MVAGLMASKKRTVLDAKADCSFKFKRETAQTLKIYLVQVSDRGNKCDNGMNNSDRRTGNFGQQK